MAPLRSLKFRIALVIFLLEGVMMALVLWQTLDAQTKTLQEQRDASEQVLTELVARISRTALLTDEFSELKFYYGHLQQDPRVRRVLLANPAGIVVASADLRDLGQRLPPARDDEDGRWRSVSITNASGVMGTLAVKFARGEIMRAQAKARRLGIVIATVGMSLIAVVGIAIGYLLTRRLDRLAIAAKRMAVGDLDARAALPGHDELAEVGRAFDLMAEQVARNRAELEGRVQARTAQLEAANKELEAFSYSVSHDLRAPLRAVDGFSRALLEDYGDKLDATGKNYLERVRNGAQNMGILIDDLLKLARVTRAPLHPAEVDLSTLAREIVAQLRERAPTHQVQVAIADGLRARGDPGLLRIVLENLLDNAWKYTGRTTDAQISFDAEQRDGTDVFRVRDNGAGFDMQFADKLFGAFQRLHHRDQFDGTGVGLATVARIVRRHGGRVWAEAEPGKGACFSFTLGAAAGSPA
jgi:signal transduction histidine kinase